MSQGNRNVNLTFQSQRKLQIKNHSLQINWDETAYIVIPPEPKESNIVGLEACINLAGILSENENVSMCEI